MVRVQGDHVVTWPLASTKPCLGKSPPLRPQAWTLTPPLLVGKSSQGLGRMTQQDTHTEHGYS